MRSYEDKWMWLRSQLEDDAATLQRLSHEAATAGNVDRAAWLHARHSAILTALHHMGEADRIAAPNA